MTDIVKGMLKALGAVLILGSTPFVFAEDLMGLTPMNADQLEGSSGRQGVPLQWQLNETEQSAIVTGNVLSGHSVTGDNMITDQAFSNMSGIATVIQNTGNQVVIQDSTQVNILINH